MPRVLALGSLRHQLQRMLRSTYADNASESESSASSNTDNGEAGQDKLIDTPTPWKYPILQQLGIPLD